MKEKDTYLQVWDREHNTTLKILRAFPTGKPDLKPAEKSRTAKELAWTFVIEQSTLIDGAIDGHVDFQNMPRVPASLQDAITKFENDYPKLVNKIKAMSDDDWNSTIDFFVGPKQMGKVRKGDVLWQSLYDMIHHRGQLSVYLRLAGAKVPSIYGPSADEPWN